MKTFRYVLSAIVLLVISLNLSAQQKVPGLEEGFTNPSRESRPRVWWHWMNGNITRDGIRKDLLWMNQAGIAGFHNFDAGFSTPQVVEERLPYMSTGWKDAFNYALNLADSLDMEVAIASSPGWSTTGGPWVRKEDAMKKLVWRDTVVLGGLFKDKLPEPIMICGDWQNIPAYPQDPHRYDFYKDVAVIAVRIPDTDRTMRELGVSLSASDGSDVSALADGIYTEAVYVNPGKDGWAWVQYEFPQPLELHSVCFAVTRPERGRYARTLEYSVDGTEWKPVFTRLPESGKVPVKTMDVSPVRARWFRIRPNAAGERFGFAEFELSPVTRVNLDTEKAGFFVSGFTRDFYPTPDSGDAVPLKDIIDLSSKYKDGCLDCRLPRGRWRIYRFGWNLTGKQNGPASAEATGLEVDKFDADAVRRYYAGYLGMYAQASGGRLGPEGVSHLLIDSYEAHWQTWTADMPAQFQRRRGYSLMSWLPALTGQVLGSSSQTERFLYDWRLTLGELMVENHYDVVADILKPYGMKWYAESQEYVRAYVVDGMDVKRKADIPMSTFWVRSGYSSDYICEADIHESASVCHIYGQKVCAAESFSTDGVKMWNPLKRAWNHSPGTLKPVADAAMASGVNRFVIHCSTHQPEDSLIPGLSLDKFGQWFTRKDTWSNEARSWTDYLSRSCWMLQQGRFVADIAYYYGETTNVTARFIHSRPRIPSGFAYDFVSRDVLLNALQISPDARLTSPAGASYRTLFIDEEISIMSLPVLRRIREIADAGVLIVGGEPSDWADLQGSESEFRSLVHNIWHSGRANVVRFADIETAFQRFGLERDADILPMGDIDNLPVDGDLRWVHRELPGGHLYWVANISPAARPVNVSFRLCGKKPYIWHADTGVMEEASYSFRGGRTWMELDMCRDDAQFIVFAKDTEISSLNLPKPVSRMLMALEGEWKVEFQQGRGAPQSAVFSWLMSFSDSDNPGIRYFSGTAEYSKDFHLSALPEGKVEIDLGEVREMARVILNGVDLGLAWKSPFRLDASGALKLGENHLEIKVTDTWVNRLIGDCKADGGSPVTYTVYKQYTAEDEPLPAGLLGPVRLMEKRYAR